MGAALPGAHDQRCLHLRLDDGLLRKKLAAAADYSELSAEIQLAITTKGEEYFRTECLRKVAEPFPVLDPLARPYYETFGEQRVTEAKYASVIRYRQHMVLILTAIREHATSAMKPGGWPIVSMSAAAAL